MKFHKLSCALVLMSMPLMAIAKNKTTYPLEQVISIYSNKEYGNSFNLSKNKYLSEKEIKWESSSNKNVLPRFDFSGTLNLIRLGETEISVNGNGNTINSIDVHSSQPSKNTFEVLRKNLKTYKISKLNCKENGSYFSSDAYFYVATKDKSMPVYIAAYVNSNEEPYMSPLYTIFEFYQHKQPEWRC